MNGDERYRVQISGPGFSVSNDVDSVDGDAGDAVARALVGALEMASRNVPRTLAVLADVVENEDTSTGYHFSDATTSAESAFLAAAIAVRKAWAEHDEKMRSAAPAAS